MLNLLLLLVLRTYGTSFGVVVLDGGTEETTKRNG